MIYAIYIVRIRDEWYFWYIVIAYLIHFGVFLP